MSCKRCGGWAINHGHHGRDGSEPTLCDVCYWRQRTEQCTALNATKDAEIARLRAVAEHLARSVLGARRASYGIASTIQGFGVGE